MDGGKYAAEITPSAGKIVAGVIFASCLVLAWRHDGFNLAGGAVEKLLIPLAMIWMPEQLAWLVTLRSAVDLTPPVPLAITAIRLIGWFVLLAGITQK